MASKKLYDSNGLEFQPVTDARYVAAGVVNPGNTTYQDLEAIWSKALAAYNNATGATTVQGQLGVVIKYKNSTESTATQILSESTGWNDNMTIPDAGAPYCWKKTTYTWTVEGVSTEIRTVYEICATALYPETQTMYAASPQVNTADVSGPSAYVSGNNGSQDKTAVGVMWYDHFTGINPTQTLGFMATRHRDAGQPFAVDSQGNPIWNVALFAVYPTN